VHVEHPCRPEGVGEPADHSLVAAFAHVRDGEEKRG
jgi:hypothetical protein